MSVSDVFCSSSQLASDLRSIRPDLQIILNGYEIDHLPPPSTAKTRKYIGYVGTIGEWFDWTLVCEIARALPDVPIRLIGPEFVPRPTDVPTNVELLGEQPFGKMADYVSEFAVGLIPFKINELTCSVDPIKFYEYRSMGIPIWSTGFGEMRLRSTSDGVTRIKHSKDWRALWEKAKMSQVDPHSIAKFRQEVSWTNRFAPILELSAKRLSADTPRHVPEEQTSVRKVASS